MKNCYYLIVLFAFIASCNTKQTEDKTVHADSTIATAEADTGTIKREEHFLWASDKDRKGIIMSKMRQLPLDSLNVQNIIQLMNDMYPDIQLQMEKQSNDTVFINIPNSKYLTQQTGSSGPEIYFAELTCNLTEVKEVKYVDVKFKKGDHASPSTFARTDFIKD